MTGHDLTFWSPGAGWHYDASFGGMPMPRRAVFHGDPMPMPRTKFRVVAPAGRKPFAQVYTPKAAQRLKDAIAGEWRDQVEGEPFDAAVPLVLRCRFYFHRPASQLGADGTPRAAYRAKRPGKGTTLKDGTRTGGDVDNLAKLILDALNGVAYADDGQVVRLEADKLYTDQGGQIPGPLTIVEVEPL